MKSKFANIVDNLAISFLLALLVYCWINFVSHNKILSTISSICAGLSAIIILFFISNKRRKTFFVNKETENKAATLFEKFRFCSAAEQIDFLNKYIQGKNKELHTHFIKTEQNIFVNELINTKLSSEDVCKIIREIKSFYPQKPDKIIILCHSVLKETKTFCKQLNTEIEFWNLVDCITKLKLDPNLISSDVKIVKPQKNWATILSYAFSPARFKSYFTIGIVLIVSSFFVLYRIYYLVFGTIMLLLAIFTLTLKLKNKSTR